MIDYTKFEGHTPGPWVVARWKDGTVFVRNEQHVCVAEIVQQDKNDEKSPKDATLIAAAPDLLEACKRKDILLCKMYREHLVYGAVDPMTYDEIREELDREEI